MNPTRRSVLAALSAAPLAGPAMVSAAVLGPAPLAAGGRISMLGRFGSEAGPECWIPISRDSAGRLGVKVNNYSVKSKYRLYTKECRVPLGNPICNCPS